MAGGSSVPTSAAAAWLRFATQRSSRRGWPAPSSYSLPPCGHKSVANWPVKPGLQLWCVIMVAKSSRAVLVNQAVRVGGLAGSSALFASCTAPDKAVQPPRRDAFMPLLKVLSADTVCSCTWKGRQIWPDILSQILLCAGESGCWWWGCSSGWRQPPPRGCFPANIIAKQADAFSPGLCTFCSREGPEEELGSGAGGVREKKMSKTRRGVAIWQLSCWLCN